MRLDNPYGPFNSNPGLSWWDRLLGRKPAAPAPRALTPEEDAAEERAWIAREEAEAGGVWYVYDKGRDDPVVYKVYSKKDPIRFMVRKLKRPHGEGLRVGPWSKWSQGPEPVITVRVPKGKRK